LNTSTAIFNQMHALSRLLARARIPHWLEFGSLLGAVRSGQAIPWDHDADFGMFVEDFLRLQTLSDQISRLGFRVEFQPPHLVRMVPVASQSSAIRWVDFYPCRKAGSDLIPLASPGARFKYYHVDELESVTLEGFRFPAPRYRDRLLALRYGETWRVPRQEGWEVKNEPGDCHTASFVNEGENEGPLTGYAEGVFDLFHAGHVRLLERGKRLFDRLLVGVNSDQTAQSYKRTPVIPFAQRLEVVRACKYADEVIEAPLVTTLEFMQKHRIDYVLHGRTSLRWIDQFYREPRKAGRLHLIRETPGVHSSTITRSVPPG
jgi:cytidyltransferase-like protein